MHLLSPTSLLLGLLFLSIALAVLILWQPSVANTRGGKIFAFLALFILPIMSAAMGAEQQMERSKRTEFCLSCHVMASYGKSLHIDDKTYLAAAHYQNARIPRDEACYTCHTNYVMYGSLISKMRGLKHVYVNYLGKPPAPEDIKLYTPYNNRECLHCHEGARSFEESPVHGADPEMMKSIKSNQMSCTTSGCHDTVHNVKDLGKVKLWTPAQ